LRTLSKLSPPQPSNAITTKTQPAARNIHRLVMAGTVFAEYRKPRNAS
jgi:hypothetical protein